MIEYFAGRQLVVPTKHRKEQVIAPLAEAMLGVQCLVPAGLDTDTLGTFTGEVERTLRPREAARQKCLMALHQTGCDLVIASEASFGYHDFLPVPAHEELLVFLDQKHQLEVTVRQVSLDTNFAAAELTTEDQLLQFAVTAQFPSHALIVRAGKENQPFYTKGITDWKKLKQVFQVQLSQNKSVYVQTDMRAMYNPTRLSVLKAATQKLVDRLLTPCPQCQTPGFGVTAQIKGLPCGQCRTPTLSTLAQVHSCQHCAYTYQEQYPDGKEVEDPAFCFNCNP
ncbi:MAG: DUF6671 family protein [Rufibacter sp.]